MKARNGIDYKAQRTLDVEIATNAICYCCAAGSSSCCGGSYMDKVAFWEQD